MTTNEVKISVSVMRLFRVIPDRGSHSIVEIALLYNQRYPAASRPRQAINRLTRVPLARYRVDVLVKAELLQRTPLQNGKVTVYLYSVTPKGLQYKHDHS